MQAALCAIFCASVGLAELATRHHHTGAAAVKAEPTKFGHGVVRGIIHLPAGWVILKRESIGSTVFVAQEPDTPEHKGRTVACRVKQLPEVISPLEYLQTGDVLDDTMTIVPTGSGSGVEQVIMDGIPWVILQITRETADESENQWIGCCVLPGGQAITLIMNCPPPEDPDADRDTFHEFASSIEFRK
jgi:hypothetical protein